MSPHLERRSADLGISGVTIDALGLVISEQIEFCDWEQIGANLGALRDLTAWSLGDWLNAGEALFGEDHVQGAAATGRSITTLLEHARVARKVPRARRRPELSFTHHQVVAAKPPAEQDELLDRASSNGWSVEQLRAEVSGKPTPRLVKQGRNLERGEVEILEPVEEVARKVLAAARPLGDGYARVPEHLLDRLANALGCKTERA